VDAGVPTGENEGEWSANGIADQVNLAGQPTSGSAECQVPEPPSRAPAVCWWARTMMESTDASQSVPPAASARACASLSIRSNVPSLVHRRKRVCRVAQDPYRSGTSRQDVPVRNFQTIPLRTRVVQPLPPTLRPSQQRTDELPLSIRQFIATYHPTMIHHPRSFDDRP
jgi:hypothetical protein